MKFSLFFCFLPFTLSVPSVFIPVKNYYFSIPQQTSLNIWYIPPATSSEPPVRIHIQALSDLELGTNKTYIILQVKMEKQRGIWRCKVFYWMGFYSPLADRQKTAGLIPTLMYEVSEQLYNNFSLIRLSREMEFQESDEFRSLLGMRGLIYPKLYKVTGSMGQYIIEVPNVYSELNGTDSFLLDKSLHINIWNADPVHNKHKQEKAYALAKRMMDIDRPGRQTDLEIGDESSPEFEIFKQRFFKFLRDGPSSLEFPKHQNKISDDEILNKRNNELRLFEYSWVYDKVIYTEIVDRPLELNYFKTNKTLIMLDYYIGNVFIYIGQLAHHQTVTAAMTYAEYFYFYMEIMTENNVSCRKLTVVREGYPLPTHFIVNFPKEVNNLGYLPKEFCITCS